LWSFSKAPKRILYRQFLCFERSSDCSSERVALPIGPVPTLGSPIDLTKEHSDIRRYSTHDSSIRTRYLMSRVYYTDDIGLGGAARTQSHSHRTNRWRALGALTAVLIESTLNVGSDSGLSTVGLGRVKSVDTGDARCHRRSGPAPNDHFSERPRQFL
jgi:hypothetical protein